MGADDAPFVDISMSRTQSALHDRLLSADVGIRTQVLAFYEARRFRPVWTDPDLVAATTNVLSHAYEQGLRAADYAASAKPSKFAEDEK